MSRHNSIPDLEKRVVCIVEKEHVHLAAVISSYFSNRGVYFSIFTFPAIVDPDRSGVDFRDDDYISTMIGTEAATLVNNALARIGGCDYLILAGLSDAQKSYLHFSARKKILEIATVDEVRDRLASIGVTKPSVLRCKSQQVLLGLHIAKGNDHSLAIDDAADELLEPEQHKGGMIIVEQALDNAASVAAVNYAFSVHANIKLVKSLNRDEARRVLTSIQRWRNERRNDALQSVLNEISERVGDIEFAEFEYATFFTDGLPYSLGMENTVPCSYVHLSARADLFIFNNIVFQRLEPITAALVFSLDEFFADGETEWLLTFLRRQQYFVRALIGRGATVRSLDYNAQHFPYSLLHIASHGGEVDGYAVSEQFFDREGRKHVVEYYEVVGFERIPRSDLIGVQRKVIFRTFDGFEWKSPELARQKIPRSVFDDMVKALFSRDNWGKGAIREPRDKIPASCAIQCSDSIHQGMFRSLASHSSPLVFNNTCSSWSDVADFFLSGGASGYIGTLWDVGNDVALSGAQAFYENVMGSTVIEALHQALDGIRHTADKNVYMFWGLHFSSIATGQSSSRSCAAVFRELVRSLFLWIRHVGDTKSAEGQKNAMEVVRLLRDDINDTFDVQNMESLDQEISAKLTHSIKQTRSVSREERNPMRFETETLTDYPPK